MLNKLRKRYSDTMSMIIQAFLFSIFHYLYNLQNSIDLIYDNKFNLETGKWGGV